MSGGLNPDQSELLIADNEAAEILNFRIDKVGSLVSRQGYQRYVSLAESDNIVALGRWRDGNPSPAFKVVVATDGGLLRTVNSSTNDYTTVYSGLTTSAEGMFLPIEQFLVYANGADQPVAYDGATATELGITGPAAAPGTALAGTGLTGTFGYRYTYFSTTYGWESNPSPAVSVSPADDTVTLTLVAATHPYADRIRIYRTTDGGATYLYLDDIASNLTTYADDGSVTLSAVAVEEDNDIPLDYENIAFHKGFAFGSIGKTLYWSKATRIDAWPILNSTDVPFEGNDTIVALKSFQDTLLIFGNNNTVILAGDSGNWVLIRQDVDIGCASRKAIVDVEDTLVFLSYQAIHSFPGFQQVAPKLTRTICQATSPCRRTAAMVYVPEERSIWLSMNDRTWTIHLLNGGIGRYGFYAFQFLRGGEDGYSLPLWIDSDDGPTGNKNYVNEYGGVTDLGANIPLRWRSKVFQLQNPEFTKFIRRIGAYGTTGTEAAITVTMTDRSRQHTVSLASAGVLNPSEWDFEWDTDSWASEGYTYFIGSLPAQTLIGRLFQVTIDAEVSSETEILAPLSFEYRESDRFLGA